jgi:hypothetical protein
MKCLCCAGELSPPQRFCPSCGTPTSTPSQMPTASADAALGAAEIAGAAAARAVPVGRVISSDSIPVGGFTPGMILAGRYSIIGLLGRGGMGEVYRADDLKLGQPVALKFLPESLAGDSVRRERFYAEVRIARQVSHPNVCRVYDISELDGRHFLTMEYIDGEDLASLLKRIGGLHGTKALDIARQLCAGLAAAHDKGVLHRDLKPANVMLDGRGRVRITDFGLAVAAGEDIPAGDASGTPAYMAPEQFAGKGASVRSDIYALGLVLYEMYTGKRAYEAATLAELRARKEGTAPTAPSEIIRDIDAIVERVILRCMEKDPRQRPVSVTQVAASLPGGDPLAAALAAGETPSPEMVAASGGKEGLRPWVAWACLAFVIIGLAVAVLGSRRMRIYRLVPMERPPEVLSDRVQQILKKAGYSEDYADSASGFAEDLDYFRYVLDHDRSSTRFDKLPDHAVQFWYRQSPRFFERWWTLPQNFWIDLDNPPIRLSGESAVRLDCRGRLLELRVIPPHLDEAPGSVPLPDWVALFHEAGLDIREWTPVDPQWWSPLFYADARVAWQETHPETPNLPLRIEAAAYHGKPVAWRVIDPWTIPSRLEPLRSPRGGYAVFIFAEVLFGALLVGAVFHARRSLKLGRGDRRGAWRLALSTSVLFEISWISGEHHVPTHWEFYLLLNSLGAALLWGGLVWMTYIGLEPFVRRRWPGVLVSWSRLLAGGFRDPLVGRDLLIGCIVGVVWSFLDVLQPAITSAAGLPQVLPRPLSIVFSGARAGISWVTGSLPFYVSFAFACLFFLMLLQFLLRRRWAAYTVFILFFGANSLTADPPLFKILINAILGATIIFVLVRFGVLAVTTGSLFYFGCFMNFPVTTQLSAWYSGIGLAGLCLMVGLAVYGFHTSLGGQPLFGRASLED